MQKNPVWYPYAQMQNMPEPITVTRAHGVYLETSDGNTLIDAISSWWCVIHGYNHPRLNQAMIAQIEKVAHVAMCGIANEPAKALAQKLVDITPETLNYVFFGDSGSVGMEVAMKMALQFWALEDLKDKKKFVSLRKAYHGDTTGVMKLADPEDGMHRFFDQFGDSPFLLDPPRPYFSKDDVLDQAIAQMEILFREHHQEIAAFVVEPIMQGAGGFQLYDPRYLQRARNLCDRFDVLFIADEVATGFGRTGTLFAIEQAQIIPDILVLGKGLAGGMISLSATIAQDRVYEQFLSHNKADAFMHGPTFMGNPTACAVALENITLFEENKTLEKIKTIESILQEELLGFSHPAIKEIRVLGGMAVIEVLDAKILGGIQNYAIQKGIWLRPFDNVVYTTPPYIITEPELRKITAVMKDYFKTI